MVEYSVWGSNLVILLHTTDLWQQKRGVNRLQSAGNVGCDFVSLRDRITILCFIRDHEVHQRVSCFVGGEVFSCEHYFSNRCYTHCCRVWLTEDGNLRLLTVRSKTYFGNNKTDISYRKTDNSCNITTSIFDNKTQSDENKKHTNDNKTNICHNKVDIYSNKTDINSANFVNIINKNETNINFTIKCTPFTTICKRYQQRNDITKNLNEVQSAAGATIIHEHISMYFVDITTDKSIVKLLITFSFHFEMGTNCSTNFYDRRDWNSIDYEGGSPTLKSRKHGFFRNRAESDPTHNSTRDSSDVCNCHLQINNGKEGKESSTSSTLQTNSPSKHSDKRTPTSSKNSFEVNDGDQPNSPQSPNINTSFHNKFSKVIEFMRPRATSSCDVSPHRLLTRRSHYSHYRSGHCDIRSTAPLGHERQRSQSWSNGKLAYHENFLPNSPLRTSVLCPVRSPKGISSQTHSNTVSKVDIHKPDCPLYSKVRESPKLAVSRKECKVPQDLNEDWTPIPRRRAASESQTLSGRRLLPGAQDDSDLNNGHEHAHVHWADEEKGSSLSTSVFLTSIRPRSYSHGAVGSSPNKPILKKVTGF